MILSFLSAKSRKTSKSKISNKYLKRFPRNNTLKSVALAVALSVYDGIGIESWFILLFVDFSEFLFSFSYRLPCLF